MWRQGFQLFTFVFLIVVSQNGFAQLGNVETRIITFTNGLDFQGQIFEAPKLETTWADIAAGHTSMPIMVIDDGLRRICLKKRRNDVANIAVVDNPPDEIEIYQPGVDRSGGTTSEIGTIYNIGPFDEWGRRTITIPINRRPTPITQGITKITPHYCEVEVLRDNLPNTPKKEWNMRISTSSVPVDVIRRLLLRQLDATNFDDRLRVVEFFTQAHRFRQARLELASILRDFPGLEKELVQQYELMVQAESRQSLDEIRGWKQSGNNELAMGLLKTLEKQPRLPSETIAEIKQIKIEFEKSKTELDEILKSIKSLVESVNAKEGVTPETTDMAKWLLDHVTAELSEHTRNRLSAYMRLADGSTLELEEKLALAISGWIVGANSATESLALADSLIQAQPLVIAYLNSQPDERARILQQLAELEAGHPRYISKIVELIPPPIEIDLSDADGPEPIEVKFSVEGADGEQSFLAQLPPSYDPNKKYPCIVALNAENWTPGNQIGWWAGDYNPSLRMRRGLAARYGYIVIAPKWLRDGQLKYEFSATEHAKVLGALRSAMRRFSIDSDRVFLAGHYAGADAAWDIGFSHPDLWAGVIPISARASKYIRHYSQNARNELPFYFVYGERDYAARENNADVWNKFLTRAGYDAFVVEYKGRGAESFYEEIQDLYRWMNVQQRDTSAIKEFECSTMRPTDNFFWWFEIHEMKEEKIIHPAVWDITKGKSDWPVKGTVKDNRFTVRGEVGYATIWLSPDHVDFSRDIRIGGRFSESVQPSTKVLLEDVRTRADRQHPFWGRIDMVDHRWSVVE